MNDRELAYLSPTSLIVKIHDNQQRKLKDLDQNAILETNLLPLRLIKNYYFNLNEQENNEDIRIIDSDMHSIIVRALFIKEYSINPPDF